MISYRSFIWSKTDYCSIVYISESSRELEGFEFVSNEAMRIYWVSFNSTPMSSLQVITEQTLLQITRDNLSLKYYNWVKILLQNSVSKIITPEQEALYANKSSPSPFVIRIQRFRIKMNLENYGVLPDFSYSRLGIKEPTLNFQVQQ